jgi:hypothetical protein
MLTGEGEEDTQGQEPSFIIVAQSKGFPSLFGVCGLSCVWVGVCVFLVCVRVCVKRHEFELAWWMHAGL